MSVSNKDKSKHVDSIEMSFTDKPKETKELKGENLEEFKDNGKLVYKRDPKTKQIVFYDAEGQEVGIEKIDTLERSYPKMPEVYSNGAPKDGETKVRFVKETYKELPNQEEGQHLKGWVTEEVPYEECELISERQDYKDEFGNVDAVTLTIPKKHHSIVKLLRGEIGG